MRILCVIPARYNSSRLPGKPIVDICGKPMIWWVYQQAKKEKRFSDVFVATDDERIMKVCREFGMNVVMTSAHHDTPTSRLHEVSTKIEADAYMLVMGDEPLVDARCFSLLLDSEEKGELYVSALTNVLSNPTEVIDFSNQKVVVNPERRALMISRSPIPYPKGTLDFVYEKITGIQLFSKKALAFYTATQKSLLEKAEENDLLRFIEHDIPVRLIPSPYKTVSVDTPKDLEVCKNIIAAQYDKSIQTSCLYGGG